MRRLLSLCAAALLACAAREPDTTDATNATRATVSLSAGGSSGTRALPPAPPPAPPALDVDAALALAPTDPSRPERLFAAALRWDTRARTNANDPSFAEQCGVEATRALQALVTDHPAFVRQDEALFLVARIAGRASRMDLARRSFLQLIQRFPSSRLVPYAYIAFAEFFRAQGDAATARQFYERTLQFNSPAELRSYSSLRLARAHVTEGDCARGMNVLHAMFAAVEGVPQEHRDAAHEALSAGCPGAASLPDPELTAPEPSLGASESQGPAGAAL